MKKMQPRIRVRLKHKNQPTEDGMMLERSAATEPTGCEQSVAEEETMPANNGRTTEEPETTTAESGQRPDAEKKIAKVSNFAKATYGIGWFLQSR